MVQRLSGNILSFLIVCALQDRRQPGLIFERHVQHRAPGREPGWLITPVFPLLQLQLPWLPKDLHKLLGQEVTALPQRQGI